jgi:hypothetical protein
MDTDDIEPISIGHKLKSIDLQELKEIPPNGYKIVPLQTSSKEPASLKNLVLDDITRNRSFTDYETLEIPGALKSKLANLYSDYEELRTIIPTCPRCQEIHEL